MASEQARCKNGVVNNFLSRCRHLLFPLLVQCIVPSHEFMPFCVAELSLTIAVSEPQWIDAVARSTCPNLWTNVNECEVYCTPPGKKIIKRKQCCNER